MAGLRMMNVEVVNVGVVVLQELVCQRSCCGQLSTHSNVEVNLCVN